MQHDPANSTAARPWLRLRRRVQGDGAVDGAEHQREAARPVGGGGPRAHPRESRHMMFKKLALATVATIACTTDPGFTPSMRAAVGLTTTSSGRTELPRDAWSRLTQQRTVGV